MRRCRSRQPSTSSCATAWTASAPRRSRSHAWWLLSPSRRATSWKQRSERGSDTALTETFDARILELDGDRLRFTHPLLGSAVASRQTPLHRRALHARLAKVVPTGEERARHLALATNEPDRAIASTLEEAARSAHARGAPAAAAELAEQAVRLTPLADAAEARRRLLLAADRHYAAGDDGRAVALLEGARAEAAPGVERATILVQLAAVQAESHARRRRSTVRHSPNRAETTRSKRRSTSTSRTSCASARGSSAASPTPSWPSAPPRVSMTSRSDPVRSRSTGACTSTPGTASRAPRWRRPLRSSGHFRRGPLTDGLMAVLCHQLWWSDDLDPARRLLQELREVLNARNDAEGDARALWHLGLLEWRAGNWDEADRYAADSLELGTQLGRLTPLGDVSGGHRRRPPGPDRRRAGQGAGGDRPRRGRGDPCRAGGIRLGARLHRALARRCRCRARASATIVRASQRRSCASRGCASSWATCSRR